MEIEFKETKEREENPNRMDFILEKAVVLNAFIEEEIKKTCRGVKNLLGVRMIMIMNGKKMIGVTITNSAGWRDEKFVKKIENKLKEAVESKM